MLLVRAKTVSVAASYIFALPKAIGIGVRRTAIRVAVTDAGLRDQLLGDLEEALEPERSQGSELVTLFGDETFAEDLLDKAAEGEEALLRHESGDDWELLPSTGSGGRALRLGAPDAVFAYDHRAEGALSPRARRGWHDLLGIEKLP